MGAEPDIGVIGNAELKLLKETSTFCCSGGVMQSKNFVKTI